MSNISNTIIHDPGKFEGEHISVPHFYESSLDGCCDEVYSEDVVYTFIVIDANDRKEFPDLTEYGLMLWEDSQGFVRTEWFNTKAEYDTAHNELESSGSNEDDEESEAANDLDS